MKQKYTPKSYLRLALLLTLCTIIGTLIGRYLWWQYLVDMRGPVGFLGIFCILIPAALLMGLLFCVCNGLIGWLLYRYRRPGLFPALVLGASIWLIFQLPMPPDPPTPEMKHFLAHRADYGAVVEMARQDALTEHCPYGAERRYMPPPGLEYLSERGCLDTGRNEKDGLSVGFYPFESYYHSLVYVENDESLRPCFLDAYVEQKIEPHWYVCEGEWN